MTDLSRIRNVAIVGTHHSGKTTVAEAILAFTGAIARRGSVADGTTTTDHEPECIAHAQSTTAGFAHCTADGIVHITLADCPGFIDFFEETKQVLAGVDAAVVVVDADPSRVAHSLSVVEYLESRRLPHLFVINKMDRPGADFEGTLNALQSAYGRHVVAEQWPIGAAESFEGFVDLTDMKARRCDGDRESIAAFPESLRERIASARAQMLEAIADFDDHLLEELLEGAEPPLDEVERDLCAECSHDQIVPVLACAAATGAGIAALVRAIVTWLPSPADAPQLDVEGREIAPDADAPAVARVIKTMVHPQSGKLSMVRMIAGTIKPDATLNDLSRGDEKVRCAGLFRLQGKKQEALAQAGPGELVALARLETVSTGDVLTGNGRTVMLAHAPIADPVFAAAIKPKERMDEARLSQALSRIVDEDPALRTQRADVTNELLLLGSGEQHVTIAVERLSRKYKVDVEIAAPAIAYLETITVPTEIHSRYKHQTGGHGQFGDVWLRFEPRERGSGCAFAETIVGGVVPRQFIPAVEKGVFEALLHGTSGFPVTDVQVTLFDGQYHDVDSSEQSFRVAAGMAVRDALPKCKPVVLEPIVRVRVEVPSAFTSAVIAQLTGKRGQILGMTSSERTGFDVVEALVPHVELSRYITELRTATQGLGSYTWHHERYDPVPITKAVGPKAVV